MQQPRTIVQITAIGLSAKMFLIPHFKRLTKDGFRVILVASDDDDAKRAAELSGAEHLPIRINTHISPIRDLVSIIQLWSRLRKLRPHVVHAHMSKAGMVGMVAAWLARIPIRVYHNHGIALYGESWVRKKLIVIAERLSNRLATHVIFCSASTRQFAIEHHISSSTKSRVLLDGTISGIDIEKYKPPATNELRSEQRQEWGIDDQKVVLGFVGRIVPHKGIKTLIEAWRMLDQSTRQRACLVMAGGMADEDLQQLVEHAQREMPEVKFVGWVQDMASFYAGLDVLVLPSWYEGLPYSVMEAQSTGLPAIVTHVPGNIDAIVDEQTGLFVPVRDPEALAATIKRLVADADKRKQLGQAARRRIVEQFSQERVMDGMMEFYRQQLAHDPAPS
jgi:glycosyltransferase involved in cell wall biosynthesis